MSIPKYQDVPDSTPLNGLWRVIGLKQYTSCIDARVINIYLAKGWKTLGDIRNRSDRELTGIPGIGRRSVLDFRGLFGYAKPPATDPTERIANALEELVKILRTNNLTK